MIFKQTKLASKCLLGVALLVGLCSSASASLILAGWHSISSTSDGATGPHAQNEGALLGSVSGGSGTRRSRGDTSGFYGAETLAVFATPTTTSAGNDQRVLFSNTAIDFAFILTNSTLDDYTIDRFVADVGSNSNGGQSYLSSISNDGASITDINADNLTTSGTNSGSTGIYDALTYDFG